VLEHHGGAGVACGGHDGGRVDHAVAQAEVRVVVVALAVVVVHVQVAQPRARVVQPVVQAAADAGVPDVEDEPEAAQVEVAGVREVAPAGARHVLDHDVDAVLVLPGGEGLERAVQLGDHGRVAGLDLRVPVGVHDVEVRPDPGARLQVPAVLLERLAPLGVVEVPDARVAERAVHRVPQSGGLCRREVPPAEQRVQAERADLGRRRELGDALERRREQELRVGARGDADVGGAKHGAQVCQRLAADAPAVAAAPAPLVDAPPRVEAAQ